MVNDILEIISVGASHTLGEEVASTSPSSNSRRVSNTIIDPTIYNPYHVSNLMVDTRLERNRNTFQLDNDSHFLVDEEESDLGGIIDESFYADRQTIKKKIGDLKEIHGEGIPLTGDARLTSEFKNRISISISGSEEVSANTKFLWIFKEYFRSLGYLSKQNLNINRSSDINQNSLFNIADNIEKKIGVSADLTPMDVNINKAFTTEVLQWFILGNEFIEKKDCTRLQSLVQLKSLLENYNLQVNSNIKLKTLEGVCTGIPSKVFFNDIVITPVGYALSNPVSGLSHSRWNFCGSMEFCSAQSTTTFILNDFRAILKAYNRSIQIQIPAEGYLRSVTAPGVNNHLVRTIINIPYRGLNIPYNYIHSSLRPKIIWLNGLGFVVVGGVIVWVIGGYFQASSGTSSNTGASSHFIDATANFAKGVAALIKTRR